MLHDRLYAPAIPRPRLTTSALRHLRIAAGDNLDSHERVPTVSRDLNSLQRSHRSHVQSIQASEENCASLDQDPDGRQESLVSTRLHQLGSGNCSTPPFLRESFADLFKITALHSPPEKCVAREFRTPSSPSGCPMKAGSTSSAHLMNRAKNSEVELRSRPRQVTFGN